MKNIAVLFLILSPLLLGSYQTDKTAGKKDISAVRGYENWYIGNFRCGIFVPPSYNRLKQYPLVIFLHGYSDTASHRLPWYKNPILSEDPCIVLTPKCPNEEKGRWGSSFKPGISPMMEKTYEMISMVEKAFNIDKNRYYIYGSSMGGFGTFGVLQRQPDKFAAAYVECGLANLNMVPVLTNMPLWIFHGTEDQLVPVQGSRDLYKAITQAGGTQVRYTEYKGVAHNTWDYTELETTLPKWLLAQRKGAARKAPGKVCNFKGERSTPKSVYLSWDIPEESKQKPENKVWFCKIYRNGKVIKEVYNDKTTFIDSTALQGSLYKYNISAVNYYFKESHWTNEVIVDLKN